MTNLRRSGRLDSFLSASLPAESVWTLLFVGLFGFLVLRDAWVSDDAFITLRAVDQFLAGNGPVHNADERVQGFTHPLWMLLSSVVCALTGELYFAPLMLGSVCSLLSAWVLGFRVAPRAALAPAAVLFLALSRSFIDYSTSGLENPLTFLLVGVFFARYFSDDERRGSGVERLRIETLFASLLATNRLDALLLVAPALVHRALVVLRNGSGSRSARVRRVFGAFALGFVPLWGWELFSLVYYGALVPNTALAKLGTGIDRSELLAQGLVYLRESFIADYPLALLILASPLLLLSARDVRARMALLGAWSSLVYVVLVGGDFMLGRFMTPAAFLLLIVGTYVSRGWSLPLDRSLMALTLLGMVTPGGPIGVIPAREQSFWEHGVADERRYYAPSTGLLAWNRGRSLPASPWRDAGEARRADSAVRLDAIGIHSAYSARTARVVDEWALVDPLLARLPAIYAPVWRIGHFQRALPEGYLSLRDRGTGQLEDEQLAEFYVHVRRITSDPIWSAERWRSIWLMNTEQLQKYVNADRYRYWDSQRVSLEQLGRAGRSARVRVAGTGILVKLQAPLPEYLGLVSKRGAEYRVLLLEEGRLVHEFDIEARTGGTRVVELPSAARRADAIRVVTRGSREGQIEHLIVGADAPSVRQRLADWREGVRKATRRRVKERESQEAEARENADAPDGAADAQKDEQREELEAPAGGATPR